ncbi:sensor histidine kinase [Spirillospora sp. CA-294931]|uniref:sensor histidine kinase n=1 Tax=Spirillospora sp. CA-294931 TaxID=3240042 RepID=UPI003D905088
MRAVVAHAVAMTAAFAAGAAAVRLADVPRLRRLTDDLQRSRERILTAREEERRRLRRDLHDGLGPTLASLAMSLDAARITLSGEPERMEPLLSDLRDRLATTVGEIREIAHGLRPPSLDDLGLVAAIRTLAERACPQVEVRFDGEPDDLPAAVEVAAYRIVEAALANVRQHARASTAMVMLSRDHDLHLMVADSGVGLPEPMRRNGSGGMAEMRELAAEVGGSCTITSRAGCGTVVSARLPLPGRRYDRPGTGRAADHER